MRIARIARKSKISVILEKRGFEETYAGEGMDSVGVSVVCSMGDEGISAAKSEIGELEYKKSNSIHNIM